MFRKKIISKRICEKIPSSTCNYRLGQSNVFVMSPNGQRPSIARKYSTDQNLRLDLYLNGQEILHVKHRPTGCLVARCHFHISKLKISNHDVFCQEKESDDGKTKTMAKSISGIKFIFNNSTAALEISTVSYTSKQYSGQIISCRNKCKSCERPGGQLASLVR